MIQARYRTDYAGEFVIVETKWSGGKKTETREFIANPIENHHISGRAACIGTATDQWRFDYTRLARHRGGLLGSKKLQTYGTGAIAKTMRLDFTVETEDAVLNDLLACEYQVTNIVYTSSRNCILHPGEFYLIPHKPKMVDLAQIIRLAAFDGHTEVFLLGYHDEVASGHKEWLQQINGIFDTYVGTKFYIVGEPTRTPEIWLEHGNTQAMCYQDWIGYCDV
jgi:hypothetical protein